MAKFGSSRRMSLSALICSSIFDVMCRSASTVVVSIRVCMSERFRAGPIIDCSQNLELRPVRFASVWMTEVLRLIFHYRGEAIERMVNPAMDTLQDLFPTLAHPVFILNDIMLSSAFSLGFLGVQPDSHIFVFDDLPPPPPRASRRPCPYAAPSLHSPTWCQWFVRLVNQVSRGQVNLIEPPDPGMAGEAARIQDVLFRKMDGTASIYRKVVARFRRYEANCEQVSDSTIPSQLGPAPECPSTSELPIMWPTPTPRS
jgi:hypothetical protein